MSDFVLCPATRQGVRPIVTFYGQSGCGKTMSALYLARGFVGPTGKIVMGDTESGRGQLYADVIPGGYDHFDIEPPYHPSKFVDAIRFSEESGAAIAVQDAVSAEWDGSGGVLDLAAAEEDRTGKTGLHVWRKPKFEHALFMQAMLRSKIPLIVCCRAKFKYRQVKENGKTVIVKDDFTEPIQADDFLFESTVNCEIMPDHSARLTKCSHPDLRKCFPSSGPITIEHGRLLAAWCAGAGEPAIAPKTSRTLADVTGEAERLAVAKKELWKLLEGVIMGRSGKEAVKTINQWLWDEIGMSPDQFVELMTAEELSKIVEKVKQKQTKN